MSSIGNVRDSTKKQIDELIEPIFAKAMVEYQMKVNQSLTKWMK